MNLERWVEEVLARGLDDWVDAAEVASVIRMSGTISETEVRKWGLVLVRHVLENGLAEVGMVDEKDGFAAYTAPGHEVLRRIEEEWRARPKGPGLGELFWLNLTEKGEAVAKQSA